MKIKPKGREMLHQIDLITKHQEEQSSHKLARIGYSRLKPLIVNSLRTFKDNIKSIPASKLLGVLLKHQPFQVKS